MVAHDLAAELLRWLSDPTPVTPIPSSPSGGLGSASVQVALIGGVATLLGIYLSALVSRQAKGRRRRDAERDLDDDETKRTLVDELRELREQADQAVRDCQQRERTLREFIVSLGYDPDTHRKRPKPREQASE